jgi:hypothetical protein
MFDELPREGESPRELSRRLEEERPERFMRSLSPRVLARYLQARGIRGHEEEEEEENDEFSDSEDEDLMDELSPELTARPSAVQDEEEQGEDEDGEEFEVEERDELDSEIEEDENDISTNNQPSLDSGPALLPDIPVDSTNLPEAYLQPSDDQLLIFTQGSIIVLIDILPPTPNPRSLINRPMKPPCSLAHYHRRDHFPFLQVSYPRNFPQRLICRSFRVCQRYSWLLPTGPPGYFEWCTFRTRMSMISSRNTDLQREFRLR